MAPERVQRKLTTILAADVEGYDITNGLVVGYQLNTRKILNS